MPEHTYTDDTRDHSGRDPKYPTGDDVHELLRAYIQHLYDKADDHDTKIAGEDSVDRYTTDIRWYQQ